LKPFRSSLSALTTIKLPPLAPGEGNVHTGGIPPWLLDNLGKPRELKEKKDVMSKSNSKYPQKLGRELCTL
jgi:hypothetical protein